MSPFLETPANCASKTSGRTVAAVLRKRRPGRPVVPGAGMTARKSTLPARRRSPSATGPSPGLPNGRGRSPPLTPLSYKDNQVLATTPYVEQWLPLILLRLRVLRNSGTQDNPTQ